MTKKSATVSTVQCIGVVQATHQLELLSGDSQLEMGYPHQSSLCVQSRSGDATSLCHSTLIRA